MKAIVNGQARELPDGTTVAQLLETLALDGRGIAVAVNDGVVARSQFVERGIDDGDQVEIIHAVAGG